MLRASDEQYMQAARNCLSFIHERYVFEKGLFRQTAPVSEVRALQKEMLEEGNMSKVMYNLKEEPESNVIIGVLQSTLKEMRKPLMHDVYDDVNQVSLNEEPEDWLMHIRAWLPSMTREKFDMLQFVLAVLNRVVTMNVGEVSYTQLAFTMAPYFCRPHNSAFMSIRHQEDLRRIRPVIAYMIENFSAIFRDLRPVEGSTEKRSLSYDSAASSEGKSKSNSDVPAAKKLTHAHGVPTVPLALVNPNEMDSPSYDNSFVDGSAHSAALAADTPMPGRAGNGFFGGPEAHHGAALMDTAAPRSSNSASYQTWEWKVVEMIVSSRVDSFLKVGDVRRFNPLPVVVTGDVSPQATPENDMTTDYDFDAPGAEFWGLKNSNLDGDGVDDLFGYFDDDDDDYDYGDDYDYMDGDFVVGDSDFFIQGISNGIGTSDMNSTLGNTLDTTMGSGLSNTIGNATSSSSDSALGSTKSSSLVDTAMSTSSLTGMTLEDADSNAKRKNRSVGDASRDDSEVSPSTSANSKVLHKTSISIGDGNDVNTSSGKSFENTSSDAAQTESAGENAGQTQGYSMGFVAPEVKSVASKGEGSSRSGPVSNARMLRRRQVAECKSLRYQIQKFEDNFTKKNNRPPKSSDRGSMAIVYSEYKRLKRTVRDCAAMDIQRVFRGFNGRHDKTTGGSAAWEAVRALRRKVRRAQLNTGSAPGTPVAQKRDSSVISPTGGTSILHQKRKNTESDAGPPAHAPRTDNSTASAAGIGGLGQALNQADVGTHEGGKVKVVTSAEMYAKYRDLLNQKNQLKRQLKLFDDEFAAKNGRQPKKSEKEIMRPMYNQYHAVKTELEELRTRIEETNDSPMPPETNTSPKSLVHMDRDRATKKMHTESMRSQQALSYPPATVSSGSSTVTSIVPTSVPGTSSTTTSVAASSSSMSSGLGAKATQDDVDASDAVQGVQQMSIYSSADETTPVPGETHTNSSSESVNGSGSGGASGAGSKNPGSKVEKMNLFTKSPVPINNTDPAALTTLQLVEEKKTLHAYLKTYERDFNRTHGRPVMRQEDIQPVTAEYRRYKELKALLNDKK
jgi:hypothetical protein